MSSRLKAFVCFLASSPLFAEVAKEARTSRAEAVAFCLKLWAGEEMLEFNEKALLDAVKKSGLYDPPQVRNNATSLSGEGKGGVSFFSKEAGKEIQKNPNTGKEGGAGGQGVFREHIVLLKQTWQETMRHYGIERGISVVEESMMARWLGLTGFETVNLALKGARYEAKTDKFDPSKHLSITRVLDRARIDKFANLGAQKAVAPEAKMRGIRGGITDNLGRPMFDEGGNPIDYPNTIN